MAQSQLVCPVCDAGPMTVFFELPQVPVFCNVLYETPYEAQSAPRGDIRLAFCPECGMISNVAFDPERMRYSPRYENALHHSPRFQEYARQLANRLVTVHRLQNRSVIDVGCGDGHFLNLLCELGSNTGQGFDPSYNGGKLADGVTVHRKYFEPGVLADPVDLIACRHVLEHIANPQPWLKSIREACGDSQPVVFFEVPDARWTLMKGGVWDILYEHCSYFTPSALSTLFARCGFDVLGTQAEYHGQFLQIEAKANQSACAPMPSCADDVSKIAEAVAEFSKSYELRRREWNQRLADLGQDRRVAVWGAGTKGAMFLSSLEQMDRVSCVVDINPKKHGQHVAGTGHQIVDPEYLRQDSPDTVFIMNPVYQSEIRNQLHALGVNANVMCL